jgi:hypothetical protein
VPDVRRAEEPLGVRLDQHLLDAVLRRAPDRETAIVVVVVEHGQERALAADEEGRVSVAQSLRRLRKGETELPDSLDDRLLVHGLRLRSAP